MAEASTPNNEPRDVRMGRIVSNLHDRRARGEVIPEDEILAAHPDLADDLRRYLAVIGELRSDDHGIDGLIAQGVLTESDDPAYRANLGAYKTIEFIGRGGMGIVLKAYEESLDRTVALKILRPELAGDQKSLKRFIREAKAAGSLRHPNIVTVHAVGREQGVHLLVMEYIDGPTLAEVIREQGPLPTETTRRFFGHLLLGLEAAHQADLIHRDIKSSNLLIDRGLQIAECGLTSDRPDDGEPSAPSAGPSPSAQSSTVNLQSSILKLADFGLARAIAPQTRITVTESVLGTAEYMSPEQARGDQDLDQRTDLYSAGVVLYEMLTGRTPFQSNTPAAVIHHILHDEPPHPRTINQHADPHLTSLSLRLLAKHPEDRFATATETLEALKAGERVYSLEKRRRFHRHVLTALIAFGLIVGAGWLTQRLVTGGGEITDVRIDPDTRLSIQARYGDDPRWRRFHPFASEIKEVSDVVRADLDGRGRLAVVASVDKALDSGDSLFAFDAEGRSTWSMDLSSGRQWPDCGPSTQWMSGALATADVDNEPGDEIVVVAHDDHEYPTRVSIIDPRTEEIKATFWHMGHISCMWVVPDFFGSGQPAIIAQGKNNKLDGFFEPRPDDPEKLADWDVVSVVMILDPRDMLRQGDGLGPPQTARVDIPSSIPYAYAFVGPPPSEEEGSVSPGGGQATDPRPGELTHITSVLDAPYRPGDDTGPWFAMQVEQPEDGRTAIFIVDRNLALVRIIVADGIRTATDDAYWRKYWRPIIQNGKYLKE